MKKLLFVSSSSENTINHILDSFASISDLQVQVEHAWLARNKNNFIAKVLNKLKVPVDFGGLNKRIIDKNNSFKPDVIFIVKGNSVYPVTLKRIKVSSPHAKIVSWSQDDMYNWNNRSIYYTLGLKYYDLVVTQKSYNLIELKRLGAKRVFFQNKAFSEKYHHPASHCDNNRLAFDVLFIGFAEVERYKDMLFLAENEVVINVFGSGWDHKFIKKHQNLILHYQELVGEDYSTAISCSKIVLCFLRKANRDLQTSRSIEIPACRGFMLAERTDEHESLFEKDKEAVYFESKEELLDKVKYYLSCEEERIKIAQAGYLRSRKNDYSYDSRVKEILRLLNES